MMGRPGELEFDIRETFQWCIEPDGQVVRWDVAFIDQRGKWQQYCCESYVPGGSDLGFLRETARAVLRRRVNRDAEQMIPLPVPKLVVSRLI